jgi:hypothetical protein
MRCLVLSGLLLISTIALADILFEDDFNDSNADGWLEIEPDATYEANADLRYEFSFDGPENVDAVSANYDGPGYMTVPDYSVRAEAIAHDPCDEIAIILRGSVDTTGYFDMLRFDIGEASIRRFSAGPGWIVIASTSLNLVFEQPYWIRFECLGNILYMKAWQGTIEDEPDEWLLSVEDETHSDPGFFAIMAAAWGGGSYDGEFDNICVTTPTQDFDHLTWGFIKTTSLP